MKYSGVYLTMIVMISLAVFSCAENKNGYTIYPVDSLGWQEDENYIFSEITEMECDENHLYCLNSYENNILVYKKSDMKFVTGLGRKGKGPSEFYLATSIAEDRNFIYVYDVGSYKIEKFSKDFSYDSSVRTEKLYIDFDNIDGSIFGITDFRYPEIQIDYLSG